MSIQRRYNVVCRLGYFKYCSITVYSQCLSKTNQYIAKQEENDQECVLTRNRWVGLTSLPSNQTTSLSEGCASSSMDRSQTSLRTVFCGEEYHGWIEGKHPTVEEGLFLICWGVYLEYYLRGCSKSVFPVFFSKFSPISTQYFPNSHHQNIKWESSSTISSSLDMLNLDFANFNSGGSNFFYKLFSFCNLLNNSCFS